jgi:hypothetical protein
VKRLVLVVLGPLAVVGTLIAYAAQTAATQPERVATHWDLSGAPDGSSPMLAFVATTTAVAIAGWLPLLAQALRDGARELTVAPIAWAVVSFAVAVGVLVLSANAGAESWRQARGLGLLEALVPMVAAALGAATALLLERDRAVRHAAGAVAPAQIGAASVGLGDAERAVWSRRASSRVNRTAALLAGVALGGAAVLTSGPERIVLAVLAVLMVAALAVVSEAEVRVDSRGLTVALGPFGAPRLHVPLAAIVQVEHLGVDPWQWGGWGYRKLLRRRATTAVVMRGGDGLRVVTTAGRELVVTVPDARTGAGLLTDLVRRRRVFMAA